MKKHLLLAAIFTSSLALSLSAAAFESVVGEYRIECSTSYPQTGEGLGAMIESLVRSQIATGYPENYFNNSNQSSSLSQHSDTGEVGVCVTAAKK